MRRIPFNKPFMTGKELEYIAQAHSNGILAGDGPFTKKCHEWLQGNISNTRALLTHSCTAALEMVAILLNIKPGDEIIMPSFTFVSTANAFVLRGGVPVFIDVRPDTLNINEQLIEQAITSKTKAIVVVHYAGVACEMDSIMAIASKHNIYVVEDAAQGLMSQYKERALGGIGHFGSLSFHETKNIISGEGGALLVNDKKFAQKAEIVREKGTDRSRFFWGEVDKYSWQDIGSSFLPGELIAAFLWAQLESAEVITKKRLQSWNYYHELFESLEKNEKLRRPIIPLNCAHNGHIYYILLKSLEERTRVTQLLKEQGIYAMFHYIPLHSSPAGLKFSRTASSMAVTDQISQTLLRMPLWVGITPEQQQEVVSIIASII
jgi:dTDP-4-amino-4,6-dideoxygalactose transaminase